MKKITQYVAGFVRADFHPGTYSVVLLFLGLSIWANYQFSFKRSWIDSYSGKPIQVLIFFLFYAAPYLLALTAQKFSAKTEFRIQWGFAGYIVFALLLIAVRSWFPYHRELASILFDDADWVWGTKMLWNIKSSLFFFVPVASFWWLIDRGRHVESLYGLTRKNFDPKPYLMMLLLVLPLVLLASFQPDFQRMYPRFRSPGPENPLALPFLLAAELLYGIDFIFVELFFRGFLVIGMVRWLGPRAVLPMAAMYCFFHFGKPAGEAIASFFGGYLLGILALFTRSILGGVIAHTGLAWMMEVCGYLQIWMRGSD